MFRGVSAEGFACDGSEGFDESAVVSGAAGELDIAAGFGSAEADAENSGRGDEANAFGGDGHTESSSVEA